MDREMSFKRRAKSTLIFFVFFLSGALLLWQQRSGEYWTLAGLLGLVGFGLTKKEYPYWVSKPTYAPEEIYENIEHRKANKRRKRKQNEMKGTKSKKSKEGVFISYSHQDSKFVTRLVNDLNDLNADVWFDKLQIRLGDSLIQRVQEGIDKMAYLAVVLSPNSVDSPWVQKELNTAMTEEISGKRVKVLPLLYKDCEMPLFLRDKLYADFRDDDRYQDSLTLLLERLDLKITPELTKKKDEYSQLRQASRMDDTLKARLLSLIDSTKAPFQFLCLERDFTASQEEKIYDLMEEVSNALFKMQPALNVNEFEERMYKIIPTSKGDYHLVASIVRTLYQEGRFEDVHQYLKKKGMNL